MIENPSQHQNALEPLTIGRNHAGNLDRGEMLASYTGRLTRIAYVVNQYPKTSHSFIRREIQALERMGVTVSRYSIQPTREPLVHPDDRSEAGKTLSILTAPYASKMASAIAVLLSSPARFWKAARLCFKLAKQSRRGLAIHLAYLTEAAILVRWLKDSGAQHIHAHFGTNSADVALFAHVLSGLPWSFTVHGPEEFDRPYEINLSEKLRRASFAVAISSFGRSQLYRWLPSSGWPKVKVVRCGLDKAYLDHEPTPVPLNGRLLCIGRLCEQKGQLLLLEAARLLSERNISFDLVFAGDGEMRGEIEEVIAASGLDGKVRITGWLSGDEIKREIENSQIMVLPSFAEGLPVAIMEAMALGRPVISTAIAGIPELVRDGTTGYLVPAGDCSALVDRIERVLAMPPAELMRVAANARNAVLANHDAQLEARVLQDCFQEHVS